MVEAAVVTPAPAPEVPETQAPEVVEPATEELPLAAEAEGEEVAETPKFKRKINGKMIEATEDELWKHYGLEVSAREKMEEAARMRKEVDGEKATVQQDKDALAQFLQSLREKPQVAFDLLEKMGHDAKQIARKMVLQEMEWERMTPEQQELHRLREEKARWDAEQQELKSKKEKEQEKLIEAKFVKELDETLAEALKLSGLQPKPKTVARMAEACQTLLNASKTGDLPSADQIVKKFLAYMRQDASELMVEQDPEKLIDLGLLSDKSIERIAKYHLEKTKKNLPGFGSSKATNPEKREPRKSKVGINQWFDKL